MSAQPVCGPGVRGGLSWVCGAGRRALGGDDDADITGAAGGGGGPAQPAGLRFGTRGEPFARSWIVREEGRPIGYLILTLGYSVEYGGRDGFIDDLYLVPAARGRGVGGALLEFALASAAALGIRTLHLEVEAGNEPAARLYRSAGFEESGRRLMRIHLRSEATSDEQNHNTPCASPRSR